MSYGKKGFAILCVITAVLAALLFVGASGAAANATDGVIHISDVDEFLQFRDYALTNQTRDVKVSLENDIDLTSSMFLPLGNGAIPFNGLFDGNGHTVTYSGSGVTATNYVGLFGYIGNNGAVENLKVVAELDAEGVQYVGGIAGYCAGAIRGCRVFGTVIGTSYVGGIAGSNIGEISESLFCGEVEGVSSGEYVGGIAGDCTGKILSCYNSGSVRGARYVGGASGRISGKAVLSAFVNAGDIFASGDFVGGAVGLSDAVISDCYNFAQISAKANSVGSVIGSLSITTEECGRIYNVGDRSGRSVVGNTNVTVPNDFRAASCFEVLSGSNLFATDTLVLTKFDVGYGYLSVPEFLTDEKEKALLSPLRVKLFGAGDGEWDSPFEINDEENWILFSDNLKIYSYQGLFVKLCCSPNVGNIAPLGLNDNGYITFLGTFDGNGNTVTYSSTAAECGLFRSVGDTGVIKNLTVNASVNGSVCAGGVAADFAGAAANLVTNGSVTAPIAGGLFARLSGNNNSVSECINHASVSGSRGVGGIFGTATGQSILSGLVNDGAIQSVSAQIQTDFGGIGGRVDGEVGANALLNKAEVTAYKAVNVGGIFGYIRSGSIENAFNIASVTGQENVGGICGSSGASISSAGVIARISGAMSVGGICCSGTVSSSYFSGPFGRVTGSKIYPETFRSTSADGGDNVYYNSDAIFNSDINLTETNYTGTGKTYVEMTHRLFASEKWDCRDVDNNKLSEGYLPILADTHFDDDPQVLARAKYEYFSGGSGTAESPYTLSDEQQYRNAALLTSAYENYRALSYRLTDGISFRRSVPVFAENGFSGSFDGGAKPLYGVDLKPSMFGTLSGGASITGVALESGRAGGASITEMLCADAIVSDSYSLLTVYGAECGGIVRTNEGAITRCIFAGRIENDSATIQRAGGLACDNAGNISECVVNAYIEGVIAGGIAAENTGNTLGVSVNGTINGLGDESEGYKTVGGFFGKYDGGPSAVARAGLFLGTVLLRGDGSEAVTSGKTAFFAGTVSVQGPPTIKMYFNCSKGYITVAYRNESDNSAWPVDSYKKTTEAITSDGFVSDNLEGGYFGRLLSRDSDSVYGPVIIGVCSISERAEQLALAASAISVFDKNPLSAAPHGSEQNPYLISTAEQLLTLAELTDVYDYSGKYFKLVSDLDFAGLSFSSVGRYIDAGSAQNRVFNGTFDGNYFELHNIDMRSETGYTGVFGYAGTDCTVKNLFIGSDCSFDSRSSYAGSLVGYNKGSVDNVISYAAVNGQSNAGGLIGFTENGTSLKNSAFVGTVTSDTANSAYGIIGQNANTVRPVISNVKYFREYVLGGSESYVHNDYGDVVFLDRGGDMEVSFEDGAVKISITPENVGSAAVKVMTGQDLTVYEGDEFGLASFFNPGGIASKYYIRFVYHTYFDIKAADADKLRSSDYGEGYFYEGQKVRFIPAIKYGYYIVDDSYYADNNVVFTSVGERIILEFFVTVSAGKCAVPLGFGDFSELYRVELPAADSVYDGGEKELVKTVLTSDDIFKPFEYRITDSKGADVAEIIDAGEYSVKLMLITNDTNRPVGVAAIGVEVLPKAITLVGNSWTGWKKIATKDYDGSDTARKPVPSEAFSGISTSEADLLGATVRVTWVLPDVGKRSATLDEFTFSGVGAKNYSLNYAAFTVDGEIKTKSVTVTVAEENLFGYYNARRPEIARANYESPAGGATVVWSFKLLTEEGAIDSDWEALGESEKTWNAGKYLVEPKITGNNYQTEFGRIEYRILPREITEASISGYSDLTFDATDLSEKIKGRYFRLDGTPADLSFKFKRVTADGEENVTEVKHAGEYIVEPVIDDGNYILKNIASVGFTVARAQAPAIEFTTDSSVCVSGDRVKLSSLKFVTVCGKKSLSEIDGATLSAAADKTVDRRGEIIIESDGEDLYLRVTKYPEKGVLGVLLSAVGCTDYEDSVSSTLMLTVTDKSLYVGFTPASSTYIFGEVHSYELCYSLDAEQTNIVSGDTIAGLVEPDYMIPEITGTGSFGVSFLGGASDIYKLVYTDTFVTVRQRKIRIEPLTEDLGKIYGAGESPIGFTVYDITTANSNFTKLPDGRDVVINGAISREEGENVGPYAIREGTLTAAANPDYDIELAIIGKDFVIRERRISLIIEGASKPYGLKDPVFTFVPSKETPYADEADAASIFVDIEREEGEDVGYYDFTATDWGSIDGNYIIERVDARSNFFEIVKAEPVITVYPFEAGALRYGDALYTRAPNAAAYVLETNEDGQDVYVRINGIFAWVDSSTVISDIGEQTFEFTFEPTDDCYAIAESSMTVNVAPRIAEIRFTGSAYYTYNGLPQGGDAIGALVENAASAYDKFEMKFDYDVKQPVNAGNYRVTLTDVGNPKYTCKETVFEYEIAKAVLTVKPEDGEIRLGERFVPKIKYEGFVNGEDERVLINPAMVTVPTEAGIHVIKAEGAEADNYRFAYAGAQLKITRDEYSADNVTMTGDLGVALTFTVTKTENAADSGIAKITDRALGYNVFIPNTKSMKEYYGLKYSDSAEGEFVYTVKLELNEGETIAIVRYDGTAEILKDYSYNSGSITFTSEQVAGIAVYEPQKLPDVIKGFIPLIATVAGVILVGVAVAVAIIASRRRTQREKKYLSKFK